MANRYVINAKKVMGFSPTGNENNYISRLLIDDQSVGSRNLVMNHFTLLPGKSTSPGSHPSPFEEVYYILRGKGLLTLGGEKGVQYEVTADTAAYIPCDTVHELKNIGEEPLVMLTMMPFLPTPGANGLYDERKKQWGTSYREVE